MEEFYTAIGIKREPGSFSVVLQGERFSLFRAETLLWTILQGRFLKKDEIYPEIYARCLHDRMEKTGEEEAAYCLRRLTNRRLVIKIPAEDPMDATEKDLTAICGNTYRSCRRPAGACFVPESLWGSGKRSCPRQNLAETMGAAGTHAA